MRNPFAKYERRYFVLKNGRLKYYKDELAALKGLESAVKGGYGLQNASISGTTDRLKLDSPVSWE